MLPNRIVCHGSSWRQFEAKVSTPPIDAMCSLVSACAAVVDEMGYKAAERGDRYAVLRQHLLQRVPGRDAAHGHGPFDHLTLARNVDETVLKSDGSYAEIDSCAAATVEPHLFLTGHTAEFQG
jgi:hypothetical protein